MNSIVNSLKEKMLSLLDIVDILDKEATQYKLRNEQWFLDWQDKLNEISVR